MTEKQKAFGKDLRRRREDAGYTPDEFARLIGIASRTLQSVELGSQKMGEAARMKAEAVLAGTSAQPVVGMGEGAVSHTAGHGLPAILRQVSAIVVADDFGSKVDGVAKLLGIPKHQAAEIVLTQEMRREKS